MSFRDRHGLLVRVRLWHFVCDMTHLRKGIVRIASAVDETGYVQWLEERNEARAAWMSESGHIRIPVRRKEGIVSWASAMMH